VNRQKQVVERLEDKVRAEMRRMERASLAGLNGLWNKTRNDIKASLVVEYRQVAPTGCWSLDMAKGDGAIYRMERSIYRHMDEFRALAKSYISSERRKHYDHEYYTSAYVLDQVTPPCCPVILRPVMREASVHAGPDAVVKWTQRFDGWASAWEASLKQNLMLNAINSGTVDQVTNEVDATRIGTPAVTLWDAIGRLFQTELLATQAAARENMTELNSDMISEEIWQTMEDERVCPECGPLDQLTRKQVEEEDSFAEPPLHPNCRCFWRVMPKSWTDLAQRDHALAHALDKEGAVPDGMYILGPDGKLKAAVVVSFNEWAQDKIMLAGK
jgi:hypothetical protein